MMPSNWSLFSCLLEELKEVKSHILEKILAKSERIPELPSVTLKTSVYILYEVIFLLSPQLQKVCNGNSFFNIHTILKSKCD